MALLDESLIDWQWLADVGLDTELPIPDYTCNLNTCDSHQSTAEGCLMNTHVRCHGKISRQRGRSLSGYCSLTQFHGTGPQIVLKSWHIRCILQVKADRSQSIPTYPPHNDHGRSTASTQKRRECRSERSYHWQHSQPDASLC